jgi:tetratricopeptide (TPR) repeat protein
MTRIFTTLIALMALADGANAMPMPLVRLPPVFLGAATSSPQEGALRKHGQTIADMLNQRNSAALAQMIDAQSLGRTAIAPLELSESDQQNFIKGFVTGRSSMADNLLRAFTGKSSALVLRSKQVHAGSEHLLRFDFADDQGGSLGFGYVRFELNSKGQITDWFDYVQGLKTSDGIRRMAAGLFSNQSTVRAWLGLSKIDAATLAAFQRFTGALAKKQIKLAYQEMENLPGVYKKTQQYATHRVTLAQQIDEATSRASLEELAAGFGNEPSLQFLLIDHFFYTKQFSRAVRAVEIFEGNVSKDGATAALKCNAYLADEQAKQALAACEAAVKVEPTLALAWDSLLGVTAAMKDRARFINVFERYEKALGYALDADAMAELPDYTWLKRDRSFKKWARGRR